MKNRVIYKLTNKINGKVYIGQTVNCDVRKSQHKKAKETNKQIIHRSIQKYGWENFDWKIIEKNILNQKHSDIFEEAYIIIYNSIVPYGYNLTYGSYGGDTLTKHPDIKNIGKRISKKLSGIKRTDKTKKKMSLSAKNRCTESWRKRNSEIHTGKIISEETRRKIGEASKLRWQDPEFRKKMSKARKLRRDQNRII